MRSLSRKLWGDGDTSSSDGQFFRAGGHGEARADFNAKYGSEPGVKFYTHVSDRYAPFHTKVIAANASEAAHVLDGLMHHESSLDVREHYTDTAGAIDHVFGLCHLWASASRRASATLPTADSMSPTPRSAYKALTPIIGGPVDLRVLGENWDEISAPRARRSRPEPSRRRRSCVGSPPIPKQNALAKALREIGRVERTLFTLDWISDPALRRRSNAGLNKGEARNALASEPCSFIVSAKSATALSKISATAPRASTSPSRAIILWNTVYLGRAVDQLRSARRNHPRRASRPCRAARLGAHRL